MPPRIATLLTLVAGMSLATACDQIFSIETKTANVGGGDAAVDGGRLDATLDGSDDVTTRQDGNPGDAQHADHSLGSDAGRDALASDVVAPCTTFYVQHGAKATNDGCSSTSPLPTIQAAIDAAETVASASPTILVCNGVYDEMDLKLTFSASLLGGYDCTTWSRGADAGSEAGAGRTVIRNADLANPSATLVISGTAVRPSATIDGFVIESTTSGSTSTLPASVVSGVACHNGASPTISNNTIGPATSAPGLNVNLSAGSIVIAFAGVIVDSNASPTLAGNSISVNGVPGQASAGVKTDGSAMTLVLAGNTITGGGSYVSAGTAGYGAKSYGVLLTGATGNGGDVATFTLAGNTIHGGSAYASIGVYATNRAWLTADANAIDASPAPYPSTNPAACSGVGMTVTGAVGATVTRNRLYGGTCGETEGADGGTPVSGLYGLVVSDMTGPRIYNNMILGGTATQGGGRSVAMALKLFDVVDPDVRFNTLVGGVLAGEDGSGTPTGITTALDVEQGTTGAVLTDNILAGDTAGDAGYALRMACIPDGGGGVRGVSAFENNALLNAPTGVFVAAACTNGGSFRTLAQLATVLESSSDASVGDANVAYLKTCPDGGGPCVATPACTSGPACLAQLFAGWDAPSGGAANLLQDFAADAGCVPPPGSGWTLSGSAPCAIARGGSADPSITESLYGTDCRRTAPISMGADQNAATCE